MHAEAYTVYYINAAYNTMHLLRKAPLFRVQAFVGDNQCLLDEASLLLATYFLRPNENDMRLVPVEISCLSHLDFKNSAEEFYLH
jgi:hypothetical protein